MQLFYAVYAAGFFWRAGLVAGLQVGRALGVLAVWVWGQQFQSPMFVGTQPPYAMKALNTYIYTSKKSKKYARKLRII